MFKEVFEKVPAHANADTIGAMIKKHKANPIIAREFGGNVFYDAKTYAIVGVCIRKGVFDESQIPPKIVEKIVEKIVVETVSEEPKTVSEESKKGKRK